MFFGGLPSPIVRNGPPRSPFMSDFDFDFPSPAYFPSVTSPVWTGEIHPLAFTRDMSTMLSDETGVMSEFIKQEPGVIDLTGAEALSPRTPVKLEFIKKEPEVIDLTAAEALSPQTPSTSKTLMPTTPATKGAPTVTFGRFKVPQLHLPPTPASTPMKGTKRPLSPTAEPSSPLAPRSTNKPAGTDNNNKMPTPDSTPPTKKRRYCQNPRYAVINTVERGPVKIYQNRLSSLELERLANEIVFQVDWENLEEYVACNRPGIVYRRVVKNMILNRAREIQAEEAEFGEESSSASEAEEEEHE
ncbi:MAG: hypothetical protein Q9191_001473 [Dirinaria sp. TL-2023a]